MSKKYDATSFASKLVISTQELFDPHNLSDL